MTTESQFVPIQLKNGATIKIETRDFDSSTVEADIDDVVGEVVNTNISGVVDGVVDQFANVKNAIEEISDNIKTTLDKVKPTKASVEFGIELGYKAGELTALLVNGEGKASLNITLEWEYKKD